MAGACGVCGASGTASLPARGTAARDMRLLDKLERAARLRLDGSGDVTLCFRCIYKIEDFSEWLGVVEHYQEKIKRVKSRLQECCDKKQSEDTFKETYNEENVWQENFSFSMSTFDDECNNSPSDEFIPNAQPYASKCNPSDNLFQSKVDQQIHENLDSLGIWKENILKFNQIRKNKGGLGGTTQNSSPKFSFLPSGVPGHFRKNSHQKERNCSLGQKKLVEREPAATSTKLGKTFKNKEDLTFSFLSQLDSPKKRTNFKDENVKQAKNYFNYDWNLFKTSKKKVFQQSSVTEEKNQYSNSNYIRRKGNQGPKNDSSIKKVTADAVKTARKPSLNRNNLRKRHESVDIFASQSEDCNNSKEVGSMDWQLTPDEDLIKRVRAKFRNKNGF